MGCFWGLRCGYGLVVHELAVRRDGERMMDQYKDQTKYSPRPPAMIARRLVYAMM